MIDSKNKSTSSSHSRLPREPFFSPLMKMWVISNYDDVLNVLKNENVYDSVSNYDSVFARLQLCNETKQIMNDIVPLSTARIATSSSATHQRLRATVKHCFANHKIENFNSKITEIIEKTIVNFKNKTKIDLVNDFAKYISLQSVLSFLGVPESDFALIEKLHHDISRLFLTILPTNEQINAANSFRGLKIYLSNLIDKKKISPQQDVISELAQLEKIINKHELVQLLCDIISAGFDTTLNAMTWTLYHTLKTPSLWATLGEHPELSNTIDESLRLNLSQMGLVRLSTIDSILSGVAIPKNSLLYVLHTYANRDPQRFPDANSFNHQRENTEKIMTFGYGTHYCLGARLARNEITLAVHLLRKHYPELKREQSHDAINIRDTGMMKIIDHMMVSIK